MIGGDGGGPVRLTLTTSGALAAAVVPVFLAGSLSQPMGEELGFRSAAAGVAVSAFFVAAGLAAPLMARLGRRLGTRTAMRAGVTVSGLACLAVAGVVRSYGQLLVVLILAGTVVGLVDTAAAAAFADTIRRGRQGLAFGIKEASVPLASMVAGAAVPVAAAWVGWRGAFLGVVVVFPAVVLAVPGPDHRAVPPPAMPDPAETATLSSAQGLRTVRLLAFGIALGAGAANAAATLLVPSVAAVGWSVGTAGLLLAVASAASVAVRLAAGWASDRAGAPPGRWVAGGLGLGAVGAAALAVGGHPVVVVVGAVLALGAGWGWTGLAFLAAIRAAPSAPARAAGIVLSGLAIGGALGPTAFAALSARAGPAAGWWLAATGFLLGALTTAVAARGATGDRGSGRG